MIVHRSLYHPQAPLLDRFAGVRVTSGKYDQQRAGKWYPE